MRRFILKTNIKTINQIRLLKAVLERHANIATWSIDLDDVDKVLVVNSRGFSKPEEVIQLVTSQGFYCAELPD